MLGTSGLRALLELPGRCEQIQEGKYPGSVLLSAPSLTYLVSLATEAIASEDLCEGKMQYA